MSREKVKYYLNCQNSKENILTIENNDQCEQHYEQHYYNDRCKKCSAYDRNSRRLFGKFGPKMQLSTITF